MQGINRNRRMAVNSARADEPKRKLRWYQFSLRTLLIVVTLFAVACSWFAVKMGQARRRREAVEAIKRAGNDLLYEYQVDQSGNEIPNAQPSIPNWLTGLFGEDLFYDVVYVHLWRQLPEGRLECLRDLRQIRYIHIEELYISDADLENLEGLAQLRNLEIWDTMGLTDAGLAHFEGLKRLEGITLANTKVSDAGLAHLSGLTELDTLCLQNASFPGSGLDHVRKLPKLQFLSLNGAKLTDDGWKCLANMAQLQGLYLSGSNIADANLEHVANLKNLRSLYLDFTHVTDAGMRHVKECSEIRTLDLSGTAISDAGLAQLRELHHLENLGLRGAKTSNKGVAELRKAVPALKNVRE
jgi:Leucine-rich repeat (LRR) protein